MSKRLFRIGLCLGMLLCFGAGVAGAWAQQPRSPFTVPENRLASLNYPLALRQLQLKGIVHTEFFSGILVQVGGSKSLTVLQPKARIRLDHGGAEHFFTVARIEDRSVVLSSDEGTSYEVLFQ